MNRLKATDTAILGIFAATALALSSCTSMVCLSGLCPSEKEHMERIPWNPPSLNQQNCPNISGKYKTGTYISARDYDELTRQFPSLTDRFGFIHASLEVPEKIPSRFIPMPTEKNLKSGAWDYSEFYNSAYVLIQQNERELTVSLIGGDGKLYRRQTISINSPMIGCANGDFVIRELSVDGGSDGTSSGATATEKRFRKLAAGQLQVTTQRRYWGYDPAFGLVGLGPDGSRNNTGIPREKKSTETFAPVP